MITTPQRFPPLYRFHTPPLCGKTLHIDADEAEDVRIIVKGFSFSIFLAVFFKGFLFYVFFVGFLFNSFGFLPPVLRQLFGLSQFVNLSRMLRRLSLNGRLSCFCCFGRFRCFRCFSCFDYLCRFQLLEPGKTIGSVGLIAPSP